MHRQFERGMIQLKKIDMVEDLISFVMNTDVRHGEGGFKWKSPTSAFITFNKGLPRIGKPVNHSIVETSFARRNLKWLDNSPKFTNLISHQS